jgi:hypothetical protein
MISAYRFSVQINLLTRTYRCHKQSVRLIGLQARWAWELFRRELSWQSYFAALGVLAIGECFNEKRLLGNVT